VETPGRSRRNGKNTERRIDGVRARGWWWKALRLAALGHPSRGVRRSEVLVSGKNRKDRGVDVSRLPRGPRDDERRLGESSRQGVSGRVERRARPLGGRLPAGVLLGAHRLGRSKERSRDREAAEVTAGRAEKRKEAERAVLAASRRWRKSPHLVPSSGGPGAHREAHWSSGGRSPAQRHPSGSHRLKASWFGTPRELTGARGERARRF
jgi:hypothetical protein